MVTELKAVNIKGKEYVAVNERVKYFVKKYKGWSIETDLLSNNDGVCVFIVPRYWSCEEAIGISKGWQ